MSATGALRTQRRTAAKARGGAPGAVQPAPAVPAGAPAPAPSVRMAPAIGLGGQAQRPVQAKVAVGAPEDPFEREADRAATAVVEGGPTPQLSPVPPVPGGMAAMGPAIGLQRAAGGTCPACGGEAAESRPAPAEPPVQTAEAGAPVQMAPAEPPVQMAGVDEPVQSAPAESPVRRAGSDGPVQTAPAEPPLQRAETRPVGTVAGISPTRAARAEPAIRNPSPGSPMHGGTRASIESRLGVDLGGVRVHDGAADRRTGAALGARAFTHGNDIWLGPGEGQTDLGLMAHESAHVVQQGAAGGPRPGGAGQAGPGAAAERQGGTGQAAAAPPAPSTPVTVAQTPATESGPTRPAAGAAGPSAGAGSAASAGAGGSAGDAAGGGGGGPAAAAGGGGATGDGLLMPEPREGLSVADRARLAEVGEAMGGAAEAYQTLPPPRRGSPRPRAPSPSPPRRVRRAPRRPWRRSWVPGPSRARRSRRCARASWRSSTAASPRTRPP